MQQNSPTRQRSPSAASLPSPHPDRVREALQINVDDIIFYPTNTPLLLDIHRSTLFNSLPPQPAFQISISQRNAGRLRGCLQWMLRTVNYFLYGLARQFLDHLRPHSLILTHLSLIRPHTNTEIPVIIQADRLTEAKLLYLKSHSF